MIDAELGQPLIEYELRCGDRETGGIDDQAHCQDDAEQGQQREARMVVLTLQNEASQLEGANQRPH